MDQRRDPLRTCASGTSRVRKAVSCWKAGESTASILRLADLAATVDKLAAPAPWQQLHP